MRRPNNGDKSGRPRIGKSRLLVVLTQEQDAFLEGEVSNRGLLTRQDVIRQMINDVMPQKVGAE